VAASSKARWELPAISLRFNLDQATVSSERRSNTRYAYIFATPLFIFLWLTWTFLCTFAAARIAARKRRSIPIWAGLVALCTPALVVLIALRPKPPKAHRLLDRETDRNAGSDIIVLIHGIRTHAHWEESVASCLRASVGIQVQPIRYDYIDLFSFLCPIYTRRAPIDKISLELEDIQAAYPAARLSIVAHSFGTYALM
jgi:hypothetical protein